MTKDEFLEIRTGLLLSQTALGERLGVHYTTVARWETGRTEIPRTVELALKEIERTERGTD